MNERFAAGTSKWVVRAKLPRGSKPGDEAGLLAVYQRMSATVPSSPLALDEAEQVDEQRDVAHV